MGSLVCQTHFWFLFKIDQCTKQRNLEMKEGKGVMRCHLRKTWSDEVPNENLFFWTSHFTIENFTWWIGDMRSTCRANISNKFVILRALWFVFVGDERPNEKMCETFENVRWQERWEFFCCYEMKILVLWAFSKEHEEIFLNTKSKDNDENVTNELSHLSSPPLV